MKDRDDVMLENAPPASHLLNDIMEAIENRHVLHFTYKSHFKEPKICEFQPAFVLLFRQQWYVIGVIKDTERTVAYALERMRDVNTLQDSFCFISRQAAMLKPEQYFKHCFDVIRQYEPIRICFRAFWPQNHYQLDTPIHSSQTLLQETEDYSDFEFFVRSTYDLKQELLWHCDKLAILSPDSFKEDMINVIQATLQNYQTGQNHAIDE